MAVCTRNIPAVITIFFFLLGGSRITVMIATLTYHHLIVDMVSLLANSCLFTHLNQSNIIINLGASGHKFIIIQYNIHSLLTLFLVSTNSSGKCLPL